MKNLLNNYNLIILLTALLFSSTANAQEKTAASKKPETVTNLEKLKGKWIGQGSIKAGSKTTNIISYETEAKTTAEGWGLISSWKVNLGESGIQKGTGLWGFNTGDNLVHWFIVTDKGEAQDHAGKWKIKNKLELQYSSFINGLSYNEEIILEFITDTKIKLTKEILVDGEPESTMEVILSKL